MKRILIHTLFGLAMEFCSLSAAPLTNGFGSISLDFGSADLKSDRGPTGLSLNTNNTICSDSPLTLPGTSPGSPATTLSLTNGGSGATAPVSGNGPSAAALTIASGAIRIPDAHISTTTPAFRITVTSQNSTAVSGAVLIDIDHPLLNADPNALAYLTPNGKLAGTTLVFPYSAATLAFSAASQRWLVVQGNRNNEAPLSDFLGQRYTILVIKP